MTSPYRNEIDALRERKTALEHETNRLRTQREQLAWIAHREAELAQELADVDAKLAGAQAKRQLPLLDRITVATPCSAKWDDMVGDERTRFCLSCDKNVYNLTALPREDAEAFLREKLGGDVCVRFYQRADGTIMTNDCEVGVRRKRRKQALGVAGAIAFGATAISSAVLASRETVMGKMTVEEPRSVTYVTAPIAPPVQPLQTAPTPDVPPEGKWIAGGIRAMPTTESPKTPPQPKLPIPKRKSPTP